MFIIFGQNPSKNQYNGIDEIIPNFFCSFGCSCNPFLSIFVLLPFVSLLLELMLQNVAK